jgi:hypothetical protein
MWGTRYHYHLRNTLPLSRYTLPLSRYTLPLSRPLPCEEHATITIWGTRYHYLDTRYHYLDTRYHYLDTRYHYLDHYHLRNTLPLSRYVKHPWWARRRAAHDIRYHYLDHSLDMTEMPNKTMNYYWRMYSISNVIVLLSLNYFSSFFLVVSYPMVWGIQSKLF